MRFPRTRVDRFALPTSPIERGLPVLTLRQIKAKWGLPTAQQRLVFPQTTFLLKGSFAAVDSVSGWSLRKATGRK